MENSTDMLASAKNVRADLMNLLAQSGTGGSPSIPPAVSQSMRILEMIRHFQGDGWSGDGSVKSSLRDALCLVLRAMHYEFPMQNITVSKFLPPEIGAVPLRREHLETIFFQLLYRARQSFGADGGMIIIKVREKDYLSDDNRHKKTFIIEVSDSRGKSGEDAPVPEDPLCLALVTTLAEYYGGNCRSSRGPKGTTVVVEIPA